MSGFEEISKDSIVTKVQRKLNISKGFQGICISGEMSNILNVEMWRCGILTQHSQPLVKYCIIG